jgi:hypothetical protein
MRRIGASGMRRRRITPSAPSALTVAAAKLRLRWSNTAGICPGGVASTSPVDRPSRSSAIASWRRPAAADDQHVVSCRHAVMISGKPIPARRLR